MRIDSMYSGRGRIVKDRSATNKTAEILPPEKDDKRAGASALEFPELNPDMKLGLALQARLRYWGYRRTLDTYRTVVASGLDLTQSLSALYRAKRELEEEKERWGNVDTYREGVVKEAEAFLRNAQARYLAAEENEIEAKISLQAAKDRLAALKVLRKIDENDRAAEAARAETRRLEAERQLEEARNGGRGSSYRERRRQLEQQRKDYEALMADKQADIEKYGGEDKLPQQLKTLYENAEDDLGFGER